jgi:putative flippase GtrA
MQPSKPMRTKWREVRAFPRYAVVGILQNAILYCLTLMLLWLGWRAWQAMLLLYPVGVAASFAVNRLWSFGDRARTKGQFGKYLLVYAAAYPFAVLFTRTEEQLGMPSWLASLGAMVVTAAILFLVLNNWVFGRDRLP